jgi:hypothetical protein
MNSSYKFLVSAFLLAAAVLIPGVPTAKAVVVKQGTYLVTSGLERSSLLIEVRGRGKRAHRRKRPGRPPGFNKPNNRPNWKKRSRRRFWGRVVGGMALGPTIAVVTAGRVPPRPSSDLCWTWSNSGRTNGYWYHCTEPY